MGKRDWQCPMARLLTMPDIAHPRCPPYGEGAIAATAVYGLKFGMWLLQEKDHMPETRLRHAKEDLPIFRRMSRSRRSPCMHRHSIGSNHLSTEQVLLQSTSGNQLRFRLIESVPLLVCRSPLHQPVWVCRTFSPTCKVWWELSLVALEAKDPLTMQKILDAAGVRRLQQAWHNNFLDRFVLGVVPEWLKSHRLLKLTQCH